MDDRTRESHANLDHEIQELEDEFSNGLQYPGDPSGDPSEVYNCRCTMKGFLPDYDTDTDEDGERFARDPETGEAEYVSASLTYSEWIKNKENSNSIISGGVNKGALTDKNDPFERKRSAHAELYYDAIRNSKKEDIVKTISANTGFDESDISDVYDHVFVNKYDLEGKRKRFDADYDMAESFRRLREGKNIQEHDIILLKHEAYEYKLMNEKGLPYDEAHKEAEKLFNYKKALDKFKRRNNL